MTKILSPLFLVLFSFFFSFVHAEDAPIPDAIFPQASSVSYRLDGEIAGARLQKVVVDYRDNVFVLSDRGLLRVFSGPEFGGNLLAKDYSYASLADLIPTDITVQEGTGYLYYLYADRFLTNAHAGTIGGKFPSGAYSKIVVGCQDDILLLGEKSAALYHRSDKKTDLPLPPETFLQAKSVDGRFYLLTSAALYRLDDQVWTPIHRSDVAPTSFTPVGEQNGADFSFILGTKDGYYSISADGKKTSPPIRRVPVPVISGVADFSGDLWFWTENGAFRKDSDRFRYFAGKRWLDQNRVLDLAADSAGNVFFLTETGLREIHYVRQTLAEKAAAIQRNLEKNHLRFGWSAAAALVDPSDRTTLSLRDSDNDGLWTSIWLGSQAFRWAVTKDETARRNVWESFEAFQRNLSIHDVKGFSARTFERKGFASGPAWRDAPDSDWVWKGTTSSDEVVGYIFVADVMDRLVCQTPEEKKIVADYLDALLTHVLEHDYYLVDFDGKPTLWGRWNKDHVNRFAKSQFDRKLNSLLITAMFQLGYRLTGKEIYRSELLRIWDQWGYWENMKTPMSEIGWTEDFDHEGVVMGQDWNHSDDEMAFLTYYVLLNSVFDESKRGELEKMVADHWDIERPEKNALWNVIAKATCGKIDVEATVWRLREFPLDLRNYRVINSHRGDIDRLPDDLRVNFRAQATAELLTPGETRVTRHNANAFSLDGGDENGYEILTGEEFLLPYWMARYYRVIGK